MKKLLPFVFPLVALIIVLFLAVRWYNTQTTHSQEKIADFGDTIKMEDLPQPDQNNIRQMSKDVKTIDLQQDNIAQGQIRYEVKDGKAQFTIAADLPLLSAGVYQVWFQPVNGDAKKKAFVLVNSKGGYMGSAAISANALPVKIVVTKEMQNDDVMETVLMSGVIPAESTR